MAFRIIDAVLVTSLGTAAVAGARWISDSSASAVPATRTNCVTVEHYRPDYSPCDPVASATERKGHVRFALGPDETLVGINCAKVYPILESRVADEKWDDVVTAHSADCLDLSQWLAKRTPSGPHALLYGLCVDGEAGRQYRVGWAKFEGSDLGFSDLQITASPSPVCRIAVLTAGGQRVPGALVSLAPPNYPSGLMSVHMTTNAEGNCLVSGLRTRPWVASLPLGVGPDRTKVSSDLKPTTDELTLTSPLRGNWAFVESTVEVPFRGGSLLVADVRGLDGPAASWPVSIFVVPGTGRVRSWTWMRPGSADQREAPPVLVKFSGFEPIRIEVPSRAFELRGTPKGLVVRGGAEGR